MDLLFKMDTQLGNYMRSQFLDAIAFGVLATIGLWILGVPYFFFIGAFAGAANIIPYVGPLAGVLPGVVVATLDTGDIMAGIWVIIVFVLMKLIDDFVIQPIIVARGVELHPLMVLVVIMVGGGLFGILGMLIAVPIAGFLKVVFREGIATYRKYRFY
jgi:putative permease